LLPDKPTSVAAARSIQKLPVAPPIDLFGAIQPFVKSAASAAITDGSGLKSANPSCGEVFVPRELWGTVIEWGVEEIDLLKLDCEGAEYLVIPELSALELMSRVGWIRGEWHCRKQNPILASTLVRTHASNIDVNLPHDVGLFIAHRL